MDGKSENNQDSSEPKHEIGDTYAKAILKMKNDRTAIK